ncbi:hypothetical protein GF312_16155 [Candidatus Poribacteria bacterium]|nr:hypothetical protein [Candidatus Poribacteria bacterium]
MDEKKFLVDVGMNDLPFPMRVISKVDPEGQFTIADISINARIMGEFEARWIDKFISIVHEHKDRIGTKTLRANILDYLDELKATTVKIDFNYPFFMEKTTPVSKERCLVRYLCTYSVKVSSINREPKVFFKIEVPAITTYPASDPTVPGGLFGQLSLAVIEVESSEDIYPEEIVDIVDRNALSPVYSFLTKEDQVYIIQKVHRENISSVVMTDKIKRELTAKPYISWYSVKCSNFGMLHSYSTIIGTEKSMWVPFSGHE